MSSQGWLSQNKSVLEKVLLFGLFKNAEISKTSLLRFDRNEGRIHLTKNFERKHRRLFLDGCIHSVVVLVMIVQVCFKDKNTENRVFGALFALLISIGNVYVHETRIKARELRLFVNGLYQFEGRYGTEDWGKLKLMDKLNIIAAAGATGSVLLFPLTHVYGFHWNNPCKPSLSFYWLVPECNLKFWNEYDFGEYFRIGKFLVHHLIYLLNAWTMWRASVTVTWGFCGLMLCFIEFRKTLETFGKHLKKRTIDPFERSLMYREIQVLSVMSRSKPFISSMLYGMILCFGLSLAMLIRSLKASQSIIYTLLFGSLFIDCGMAVVIAFGGMSLIYREAKLVHDIMLQDMAHNSVPRARKILKRFMDSCPLIKVEFGTDNYIEEGTPWQCLDQGIDMAVQTFILMGSS